MEVQVVVELDLVLVLEHMLEVVVIHLLWIHHKEVLEDQVTLEVVVAVEVPQLLDQEIILRIIQQELGVQVHQIIF
jgi:hypothetical protein